MNLFSQVLKTFLETILYVFLNLFYTKIVLQWCHLFCNSEKLCQLLSNLRFMLFSLICYLKIPISVLNFSYTFLYLYFILYAILSFFLNKFCQYSYLQILLNLSSYFYLYAFIKNNSILFCKLLYLYLDKLQNIIIY